MRTLFAALLAALSLPALLPAADLPQFDDAALHAVQFWDEREGWAVGDDGVILHSCDGGRSWERQPTGVRASLRSVHFLDPFVGWAVGREELPNGAGSAGVLLFTRDGGCKWQRVTLNAMPGLHKVVFVNPKVGYVVGEGVEQFPTGVFVTRDGGRKWEPVPGPRCPGWLAADFLDPDNGALVGVWNRLGTVSLDKVLPASVDTLGGRNLRGVHLVKGSLRGVAVGQGGLVLLSDNAGVKWSYPELRLPAEVLSCWDFHAVHGAGGHLWAAGRPGSLLLHSPDDGQTWEVQRTGQPLPINALHFLDAQRGWAVGDLGLILNTADGGKSWKPQRQGGQRVGLLHLHARSAGQPIDCVAQAGGDQGFLTAAVRVLASDFRTAALSGAGEAARWRQAQRQAGGGAGELLWQFPLAAHLADAPRDEVLAAWDRVHGDKAAQQLLRQLVLAIRLWRPDVVVGDDCDERAPAVDRLVAEVVREAFKQAADARCFPEQIESLGLKAWQPTRLYAVAAQGNTRIDLTEVSARLEASLRDHATPCAGLLAERPVTLPRQRAYQLLAPQGQAARERSVMEAVRPEPGVNQRRLNTLDAPSAETVKAIRTRASLQAISDQPLKGVSDPDKLLASIGPLLEQLPDHHGAPAVHGLAMQYVRLGEWHLAREAFLLMVERYPVHPLSAHAYRWLIAHNASSETRRRHELGQFMVTRRLEFKADAEEARKATAPLVQTKKGDKTPQEPAVKHVGGWNQLTQLEQIQSTPAEIRQWHQGSLDLEPRLAAFGRLFGSDVPTQFCLMAARRNLGDFEAARQWFADQVSRQPEGPWRDAAAAELWLANRTGPPPKPAASCRQTDKRPYLDGKLDDPCWKTGQALTLQTAGGDPGKSGAKAWLAYDKDFLYFAVRCEQKPGRQAPPVKVRSRDADLRGQDRVSLVLDMDRDYATAFRLTIDQRGCVHEECWGDERWNPRWFVAVHRDGDAWQAEAAVPLMALTGEVVTTGRAWCCNVVRVLPGEGVQSWSLPAGVPEAELRPEGMGLLLFVPPPGAATVGSPAPKMDKVR